MKRFTLISFVFFLLLVQGTDASALCVSNAEANLRSGPGTKYEKLWEVFQYMPFEKLQEKSGWYKIRDFTGDVYWVYSPLVTDKYKCAVVKGEKANVRTGPGTNYPQIDAMSPALQLYSFKVLKIEGEWVHVQDEYGDQGWIFKQLLWIQ